VPAGRTARSGGGATENLPRHAAPTGRNLDLENSWCQRTLCADGTVCESVALATGNDGREVADEELDEWIATFPIEVADGTIHPRRLPRGPE
jgi:hypothetical protein